MKFLANARNCSRLFPFIVLISSCLLAQAKSGIETSGDILQFVLPAAGATLTLANRDREGAFQFGESIALTMLTTYTLKYTVDEARPNGGTHSFPSGHTSLSFSAAEYIRKRYGLEWCIPAYALASWVAYSRVESGEHHPH